MLAWVIPAAAFVVAVGLLGVTTKLALRDVTWPALIVWAAIFFALLSIGVMIFGTGIVWGAGTGFAALSGLVAVSSLVLLYVALGIGDASRVVPVTAAYPAVTVFAAAIFLGEALIVTRILGTALVVFGVILISTETHQATEGEPPPA